MKQRPQHFAEGLAARGWQVYYCEHRPSGDESLRLIAPRLSLVRDPGALTPGFLASSPRPIIHWQTRPRYARALFRAPRDYTVYDCLDYFPSQFKAEKRLLKSADLVIASSAVLYDRMAQSHPRVVLVRNACEYDHFAHPKTAGCSAAQGAAAPQEGGRENVVFIGGIGQWVDVELIGKVARLRPSIKIRCVGPVVGNRRPFPAQGNVRLDGHVSYSLLPGILAASAVAIVPFRLSPTGLAADPIKVYEYLAAGRPVVSTPIPEVTRLSRELIHLASDPSDFALGVERAMAEDTPDRSRIRQEYASKNTWDVRVRAIEAALT